MEVVEDISQANHILPNIAKKCRDVKKTIVENGDKLMKPVLEVVYVTPDGQEKRVCFEQKPLGMEFRTGVPASVTHRGCTR
eukprot:4881069-Amphidinium_carterae.1